MIEKKGFLKAVSLGMAGIMAVGLMTFTQPETTQAAMPAQDNTAIGQPYDGVDFTDLLNTTAGRGIYYGAYDHADSWD